MDKPAQDSLNLCVSCGAQTEYNFTSNSRKCSYCGAEYKIEIPVRNVDSTEERNNTAGAVLFTRDIDEFREKLQRWFTQGDNVPVNLILEGSNISFDKAYYPLYKFEGTYDGYYNTVKSSGRIKSENIPIRGKFSVVCSAREIQSAVYEPLELRLTDNYDENDIVPYVQLDAPAKITGFDFSEVLVWKNTGNSAAANFVYDKISSENSASAVEYKHYLKYDLVSASKVYMPVFECVYSWMSNMYYVYMDDKTGEIFGKKPVDQYIEPSNSKQLFKKFFLIGLGAWVSVWIIRAALVAFVDSHFKDQNYANNILVSPIGERFWLIRGCFFLVVMPFLVSVVLYPLFVKRFFKKLQVTRDKNLDLVLSGKKRPQIFG
ncbi:MAG: hypothetical protein V4520_18695 [Bacteroidota bacterium]